MWEFVALMVCIIGYVIFKLPDWAYDVRDGLDEGDLEKRTAAWTSRVTDGTLEAEVVDQVKRMDNKLTVLDMRDNEIREGHSEYEGQAWFGPSCDRDIVRTLMARRGKLCDADAHTGINCLATKDNILFIQWINDRLKEHGIDYPVYFVTTDHIGPMTAYALDKIPNGWEGKFMWEPLIKRNRKFVQ